MLRDGIASVNCLGFLGPGLGTSSVSLASVGCRDIGGSGISGRDNREEDEGEDGGEDEGFALRMLSGAVWGREKAAAGDDDRLESMCILRGPAGRVCACMSSDYLFILQRCRRGQRAYTHVVRSKGLIVINLSPRTLSTTFVLRGTLAMRKLIVATPHMSLLGYALGSYFFGIIHTQKYRGRTIYFNSTHQQGQKKSRMEEIQWKMTWEKSGEKLEDKKQKAAVQSGYICG